MASGNDRNTLNWTCQDQYPTLASLSNRQWNWEFVRRTPQYKSYYHAEMDRLHNIESRMKIKEATEDEIYEYFCDSGPLYYGITPLPDGFSNIPWVKEETTQPVWAAEYSHEQMREMEKQGVFLFAFHIDESIDRQLDRVRERLIIIQKELVGKIVQIRPGGRNKEKWPLYLRVMDAKNEGATLENIGLTLQGLDKDLLITTECQSTYDRAQNRIEQARQWARAQHQAALKVAFNFPG